jgi:hypothetical protein
MVSKQKLSFWTLIIVILFLTAGSIFAADTVSNTSKVETAPVSSSTVTVKAQDNSLAQAISSAYKITVSGQDIANLRVNNHLGYGEIGLSYGLANASGKDVSAILALRATMGWGKIAGSLGLKVSDIMNKNAAVLKVAKMDKEAKDLQQKIDNESKDNNSNKTNESSKKGNNGSNNGSSGNHGNSKK